MFDDLRCNWLEQQAERQARPRQSQRAPDSGLRLIGVGGDAGRSCGRVASLRPPVGAAMTWTLISPACGSVRGSTEPRSHSDQRDRCDLPMTIWVMLLAARIGRSGPRRSLVPGTVTASPPSRSASRRRFGDAVALGFAQPLACARSRYGAPSTARAAGRPSRRA